MATRPFTIVVIGIFTLFAHGEVAVTNNPLRRVEFECTNGKIISWLWRCDQENDCGDNSDESNCSKYTCGADEFPCQNGKCIHNRWTCDKDMDCDDSSDEAPDLCRKKTCGPSMFVCENGQCIPSRWVCDGTIDCDGTGTEDETNCSVRCKEDEFTCDNGQCLAQKWKCDGDKDCKDGADEADCESPRTCAAKTFRCLDGTCIHESWRCDGDLDCFDKSDETNCNTVCDSGEIMCLDGHYCVSKSVQCDGAKNCQDGSDELNCTGDPCSNNNGGCDQICASLSGNTSKCDCNPGYSLTNNSQTVCTDIDECQDNLIHGTCSQICKNTKGSYKCECVQNYSLVNRRYCKADGGHPELMLANRRYFRRINLETLVPSVLLGDTYVSSAVALDFDFLENKMYWTDVTEEAIFRAEFDNKSSIEEVASTNVSNPDGLAVDWINKHLYWTDTGFDWIEVSSLDGKMRKTLINTGLDEPRAIVLDPNHGLVYWTDWGKQPKIERCGMDGNDRKVIVNTTIAWPNGLTIDYVANRLYWVDSKRHAIESSDMLGLERVSVLKSVLHLRNPFAITVFEDFLYWTDWFSKSVKKYSKFGRRSNEEVETIASNLPSPMGVRVFHPYRQQILRRLCGDNNGGCSHFCLPKVYDPSNSDFFVCDCPNGFILSSDKKNCVEGGGHPELLLANRRDLRRINLETLVPSVLLGDTYVSSAVALDFDFLENKFYWTDVAKEAIFRADFDNKSSIEEVASTNVNNPGGLAVDWINKRLYWTDTGFDWIEVSSMDGKMRKTLINTGLDEPRAIVLDPNHGLVYWTDWGKQPKIERCGMDGNDRKVIVNTTIAWPNGLTIDYVAKRLYWVDSKLHTIESSDMLGLERVSVLKSVLHLRNPFAITVFEDFLYWTDWFSKSVKKYSKFGRRSNEEVETIASNLPSPMGVRVFHPYRQQILRRLCGDNNGGCSHFCLPKVYDPSNTDFFVCDCPNGFILSSDKKNCVEGGGHPELLLANRRDLRRINLETLVPSVLLGDTYVSSAVALDFDFLENKFYWTDVAKEAIFRADFDNKSSIEEVASTNVSNPGGLAVDWINKRLYWTDTGFDWIEVSSMDGKMRKTLINTGLDEPRAIVLDPNHGLVYWTDWGKQPKIERCGMDGNDRKVIVNTTIAWPNGLTIDYVAKRLYWVDSKLHTIESSDMLGLERVSVLKSVLHLRNPFAITVFEDFLYWTDWFSKSVKKYSKFGRRSNEEVETIASNLPSPMGVRVFHPHRQQILRRLCGDNNGGCSHFCLPKVYDPSNSELFVCDCPNELILSSDRKNCVEGENRASMFVSIPAN